MMQLETPRLLLREFVAEDWPAVLAYQVDPLYLRYYHETGRTEDEVRAFVQMFLDQQRQQPRTKFQLALVLKAEGRLIGNCGIRINDPDQREANIGYELESKSWGQGLASEAAGEIIRFGFTELGLHRIWSWCVAVNVGSARVLEKVAMRREGSCGKKSGSRGNGMTTCSMRSSKRNGAIDRSRPTGHSPFTILMLGMEVQFLDC
jgi:ribosomal-protein-alanine N-acetyltransferase